METMGTRTGLQIRAQTFQGDTEQIRPQGDEPQIQNPSYKQWLGNVFSAQILSAPKL